MGKADQYRRFARECMELSHIAEGERSRSMFIHMAEVWLRLADQAADKEAAETEPDEEPD